MPKVGIVTDSTCDLGLDSLAALDVVMVPLKVLFGSDSYLDWVELQPAGFYELLKSAPVLPKTSQPSPAEFSAAYERLAASGCEEIVSIHLTSALSGTVSSATMAAQTSPVPVHVIDTTKVAQGVALVVKAACAARDEGLSGVQVADRARTVAASMRVFFVLDTLEYLVKGGRAGKAAGLAASLLNIKPVLTITSEGVIEPYRKVKGRKKALAELAAHVAEDAAANGRMRVAVFHACSESSANDVLDHLKELAADVELEPTELIGAVIGTYAGPDAIGVAYYPIG